MKLSKKALKKIALMVTMGLFAASNVYALPSQGTLDNSAAATISADAANGVMNIAGKGQNNIINWASFNIDKGEIVKFNDKNNYLNLVHGVDMSRIYGTISGGNAVYLVNPNGILFAEGATLDNVGGFVASTRNISSINKEAFLNDPYNTTAVLGVDNPVMDNKDYYPEGSMYVPKITMADIQLTNVPDSATLILDGPGGVILKNRDLLNDKITHVITRQIGGELGFGYEDGIFDSTLTEMEKNKISLVNGDKYYGKNSVIPYPVRGYKWIRNWDELKAYSDIGGRIMLVNDINLKGYTNPIEEGNVILEGLGYSINGLKQDSLMNISKDGSVGLYKLFLDGAIRNINISDVDLSYNSSDAYEGAGGVVSFLGKSLLSNVNVSGVLRAQNNHRGTVIGGLTGNSYSSEIRNCIGNVDISVSNSWHKEFNQKDDDYYYTTVSNAVGGLIGATTGNVDFYNNINKGNIIYTQNAVSIFDTFGLNNIGGILGSAWGAVKILGNENSGDINITPQNPKNGYNIGFYNIGGIVGGSENLSQSNKLIGDAYSFGKITIGYQPSAYTSSYRIGMYVGGIDGSQDGTDENITSDITKKALGNYYVKNFIPTGSGINVSTFGEGRTWNDPNASNIQDDLIHHLHEMVGLHDFSTKHELPKPPTPEPNPNPNPNPDGGNTGSGTTNPPSGGNTGSGTTNPPVEGNTGSGTTNPASGSNTGSGTTNPPSSGNTGSGTTNQPSSGNTGGGITNPPSGGNSNIPSDDKEYNNTITGINGEKDTGSNIYNGIDSALSLPEDVKNEYENIKKDLINSILNQLRDDVNNNEDTYSEKNRRKNQEDAWGKIKKDIVQIPSKEKLPDDLLKEFIKPFTDKVEKTAITKITVGDDNQKATAEITRQIMSVVFDGMKKLDDQKINIEGVDYKVSYTFNPAFLGVGVLAADISWTDSNGKEHNVTVEYNNIGTTAGKQNIVNFATGGLSELAKDVTRNAANEFLSAGLKDVVEKGKIEKGTRFVEDIVDGLLNEDKAYKLLNKKATSIINSLEGTAGEKLRAIIENHVPNGKKIIKAVDAYSTMSKTYTEYKNEANRWLFKDQNRIDKSFEAYKVAKEQLQNVISLF